jgi:hypothetical protein
MEKKTKPITDKYALDYYQRTRPTRAWKWGWNVAAAALAATVVAGIYLLQRDAAFHAAPVSSAHSMFGDRCELCHDRAGQTARRLITLSGEFRSVSDNACQACHRAAEHQTGLVPGPVCVACHQEHRPDRELSHVVDSNCTNCHRELQLDDGGAVSFAAQLDRFTQAGLAHPEFALKRASDEHMGPRHGAHSVGVFAAADAGGGAWLDRGGLKFNHKLHLDPAGVMQPDRTKRNLDCAACHRPESDGQYMQPIEYERHCAECHPLRLTGPLNSVGEIPHSSVEEVRGILRERLARLRLEGTREATESRQLTRPERPRSLPLLPTPAILAEADELKIDELMLAADHAVFGLEAKGMCRHCHHVTERDGQWHVPTSDPNVVRESPDVVVRGSPDPAHDRGLDGRPAATGKMVPDRWFAHARFDHQSHRAIECGDCHEAVAESSETADILLPSIDVCRSCHGGTGTGSSRVSADCVLCHAYHDESHGTPGIPLEQLLSGALLETVPPTSQ